MSRVRTITSALIALGLALVAAPASSQQAPAAGQEYPGLETGKMWTFDVPPLEYWARRYNFHPSAQWLDHARMATLRQPGCTASFVSANGLIMTNHHCARACIEGATRPGEDLLGNGFYARTRAEERACPNYWVDQLLDITDVTVQVNAAAPASATPLRAGELRAAAIADIQRRCAEQGEGLNCQVVTMYEGGQYKLYRFRRYDDIRLVFAPEDQMAFFGGDPDNFTYPRFDLDMSFYRAYAGGVPLRPDYFRFSTRGASEGDLVFVIGNPGSTGRLNTVAQLEFLRDVSYPAALAGYARRIAAYEAIAAADPSRAADQRNTIFGLQNSQKAVGGYLSGLVDPRLMAQKRRWERDFVARVNADPALRRQYGSAWNEIATARRTMATLDARRRYYGGNGYGSRLLSLADLIVRMPAEMARPDADRASIFRDANRARLERTLYADTPIDTLSETRLLTAWFEGMAAELPPTDPVRRQALGSRSPEDAARAMVVASRIATADQRRALVEGGVAAVAASADPFIALARVTSPLERSIATRWADLTSREAGANQRIARALLAVFGNTVAPDATFSLRISDGEVLRYPYNGTLAQPFTTFYGMFDRFYGFSGAAPWNLPQRWVSRRDSIRLQTPLNAVSTNDIIGGNSGSPVIDRNGEIVGLIFDGNIEMLPNRFLFSEAIGRSVWVDSRGILEALRHVYDAGAIADELAGGQ